MFKSANRQRGCMKKRILIIDDDIDICTLLSRFLNKEGLRNRGCLYGQQRCC